MVKFFSINFIIFLFFTFAFGADLKSDLQNLIGEQNPKINEFLSKQSLFIDSRGNVDYAALCAELKKQNLLKFDNSANMQLSFIGGLNDSILMIKAITQALNNMGYKYFLTSWFENSPAIWSVVLSSKHAVEPSALYNELLKQNIYIKKLISRASNDFIYELDLSSATLITEPILSTPIRLKSAYFIKASNKNILRIKADERDTFRPFIRIFDKSLNLIKSEKILEKTQNLQLNLPRNSAYILIDDMFSVENIKRGIRISLE